LVWQKKLLRSCPSEKEEEKELFVLPRASEKKGIFYPLARGKKKDCLDFSVLIL